MGQSATLNSNISRLSAISLALSLALMACNTTPSAKNPYANGAQKPWKQAISPQDAKPLVNGFLSDQQWTDASSGWGPVEFDKSNGEDGSDDGSAISVNGKKYDKGLGVHATSAIKYKLNPANNCTTFTAVVGLDDEIRTQSDYGSVTFQIWTDGVKAWESNVLKIKGNPPSQTVSLPVVRKSTLELRVTNGGDDAGHQNWYDHADWANARVECTTVTTPPPSASNLKIQFEDFKQGGEGVGYHDNDAANQGGLYRPNEGVDIDQRGNPEGYNVGWSGAGEWMKYDLNVGAGTYAVNVRAATFTANEKLEVSVDDVRVLTANFPNTGGFDTPQVVSVGNVSLSAGAHVVKVAYVGGQPALNLDWMEFAAGGTVTPPPTEPPPPPPTMPPPTMPPPPPTGQTTTQTYSGSNENFSNPERGFYTQHQNSIDGGSLSNARAAGDSTVRMYFRIDEFRNQPLSDSYLNTVRQAFDQVRQAGFKIIPRWSYNFGPPDGNDASRDRILAHIDQLTPILRQNADIIAYLEAGFIGQWGEWHTSSNNLSGGASNDSIQVITDRLLSALPLNRMVALRYPRDKVELTGGAALTANQAFTGSSQARLGAHNDCFLASVNNWGTYNNRDAERAFYNQDNLFVPQGGETCNSGGDAQSYIGCANALDEMAYLHFSSLNSQFEQNVLNGWINGGCMEEVKQRLGYRFRLIDATVSNTAQANSSFAFNFNVANDGFAAPYNPRGLSVVLRSTSDGSLHEVNITNGSSVPSNHSLDPRFWTPGQTTAVNTSLTVPNGLASGNYEVFLSLFDPEPNLRNRSDYAIRLANQNVWEAGSGLNKLGLTLRIQ
jgi:Domain of unknown function (DUF4832)/Domain of unknown function (DUF4874)/NPCBM/NEW2 domain/DUF5010 C-terminal domain